MSKTEERMPDGTSVDCPDCGKAMELAGIDVYRCPRCHKVIDMCEDPHSEGDRENESN